MMKRRKQTQQPYIKHSELYESTDTLPLANFERCEADGDLNALKKNEAAPCTPEVLQQKWEQIKAEYADQSSNEKFCEYLVLKHTHLEKTMTVAAVKTILKLLRETYMPELVEQLRGMGYNEHSGYTYYDNEDIEAYMRDLNRIETSLADSEIHAADLANRIADYEAEQAKQTANKIKRGYFDEQLGYISKYMGMALSKHQITVRQYTTYLRQMNDYYKAQTANNKPKAA